MLFCDDFDQYWLSVNSRLIRGILVNLTWNETSSTPMCKQVVPRQSRCFHGRKVNIFGIFRVQHANREQRKYNVYSCPFFIWHLDCNERYCIKNVISHFVVPKLYAITAPFLGQNQSYPDKAKLLWLIWERFLLDWLLGTGQKLFFFFWSTVNQSTLTSCPSLCAGQL